MKNIYKHFNGIEVNMDEINSIDAELDDLTKRKIKNNIRNSIKSREDKKVIKKIIITASVSLIILSFAITKYESMTVFAEKIPVLNTLFQKFDSWYGGDYKDYTEVVGETEEDKGYEVTLNEVVMDDFSFKLIYTIKCPEKVEAMMNKEGNPFPHTPGKSIKINNKDCFGGAGGSHRVIDDYTVQVIEDYSIVNQDIPQNFNMEINFKEINNIDGDWNFKFHLSKVKISKEIKTYTPNKKIEIQNRYGKTVKLTVEKVSFSPISTAVLIKANDKFTPDDLKLKDKDGNIIKTSSGTVNAHIGYEATGILKFKPFDVIPDKISIQYKDAYTETDKEVELNLDK